MIAGTRMRVYAFVGALLIALSVGIVNAAPAYAGVMANFVKITSTSVNTSTGAVTVSYNNTLPGGASASMWFEVGGGGREGQLQRKALKSGKGTVTFTPSKLIRAIKVMVGAGGGHLYDEKSFWVLVAPPTRTYFHTVTAYEATVQRVSVAIAGIVLTVLPGSGAVRIASALLAGWTLGADVAEGLGFKSCPKAAKGQYVRVIQSQKLMSSTKGGVGLTVRYTTWASKTAYAKGYPAVCDRTDAASLR